MKIEKSKLVLPWAPKKVFVPFRRSKEKSNRRFYNSKDWRSLTKLRLHEHPLCEVCYDAGRLKEAGITDHIVPINSGGARLDDLNLMSICHSCHDKKSGKERHKSPLIPTKRVCGELVPLNRNDIFGILNK